MDDREIRGRLSRLEDVLSQLERTPGATAGLALEAVESLAAVYGEALRRIVDRGGEEVVAALADDELVGHLLVLHDLHPASLPERLDRALDEIRPYVRSHGGAVEIAGVEDGVVTVRMSGSCDGCTGASATLEAGIREALLAAAPELVDVVAVDDGGTAHPPPASKPVIPLESLRNPVGAGGAR
jgi:Fe-S cluster biogenesis protein NfuA